MGGSMELLDKEFLDACKTWDIGSTGEKVCENCGEDITHLRWRNSIGRTIGSRRFCLECSERITKKKNSINKKLWHNKKVKEGVKNA